MKLVAFIAILAAFTSASVASAATSSPSKAKKNPPAAQNAYPLTITVQPPVKGGGVNVPYVITVSYTNPSKVSTSVWLPKPALRAIVYLDFNAVPAAGNPHLISTSDNSFKRLAWNTGTLALGQTKTITIWYQPTVTFPDYTDPNTGYVYKGFQGTLGYNYQPVFTLYDTQYHMYTNVTPASPPFVGGK
jgi:hypothetical protein